MNATLTKDTVYTIWYGDFTFCLAQQDAKPTLRILGQLAHNFECPFNWNDAMLVSEKIKAIQAGTATQTMTCS